jgi:hypothetical protein
VTQIKTFLDGHQNLSQECLEAMKASFILFAQADLQGDLGGYFPTDPDQKMFQAYGWDFTLRFAMDEFKKHLAGRIEYDRMGIIRRKINGVGPQEAFISAADLPLFRSYEEIFQGPGTYTTNAGSLERIFSKNKQRVDWFWHELRNGPREESLLFVTRESWAESSKGFSTAEQDLMSAVANRYIQEVIGIADTAINYR